MRYSGPRHSALWRDAPAALLTSLAGVPVALRWSAGRFSGAGALPCVYRCALSQNPLSIVHT